MKLKNIMLPVVFATTALIGAVPSQAQTDTYPSSKVVRVIVPYSAGGSSDAQARLLADELSQRLNGTFIVENMPGGNTIIGSQEVARSPGDGYTLLWQANTHAMAPHLFEVPYDIVADFTPIATFSRSEQLLVVNPEVEAESVADFIELAEARPGKISYGSTGVGGTAHLAGAQFEALTGVKLLHVPYPGVSEALAGVLGGHLMSAFQTPAAALEMVRAGRLRALAVSGDARLAELPDVPTFAEAGVEDFHASLWFGLFGPAGMPDEVTAKLSDAVADILRDPEVIAALSKRVLQPYISTPAEFVATIAMEYERSGKLIEKAGIPKQ